MKMTKFSISKTLLAFLPLQSVFAAAEEYDPRIELQHTAHWAAEQHTESELQSLWGEDWAFTGVATFGHLEHWKCLTKPNEPFDIAVIGAPFDTATSYRSGTRMGPRAIRQSSNRHIVSRGFNRHVGLNPYTNWARVVDCGDIPITPFDNAVALPQMTQAFVELNKRPTTRRHSFISGNFPKFVTLGGDHLVALPALRALRQSVGQPLVLLHFDSHLDALHPDAYPSVWSSEQTKFNHGTVFWKSIVEGLISNDSSVHVGINTRLTGDSLDDYARDDAQGFLRVPADAIDDIGAQGIIDLVKRRIGTEVPVYVSIDIDVLDPGFAPGTGAPEPGGWSTREILRILRGLNDLNIVGGDIVEVTPSYDTPGGDTAFVAASLAYELISGMVKREVTRRELFTNEFGAPTFDLPEPEANKSNYVTHLMQHMKSLVRLQTDS